MKRLLIVLAVVGALALTGCTQPKVKVRTGEKITCTYGEVIKDTVKEIEVPKAEAGSYMSSTRIITCPRHQLLEKLYAEAQAAIGAGDLKTAQAKLEEIVKSDKAFKKAAQQLADVKAGKKPTPDTSADPGTTPANQDPGSQDPTGTNGIPEGPVASLAVFVPDTVAGYKADAVIADAFRLTRDYVPTTAGDIGAVVVVAEQFKSTDAAKAAVSALMSSDYTGGRTSVSVEGRTLQFGTYGKYAALAWNEGGARIVIEAYLPAGSPAGAKSALVTFAGAVIP